MTTEEKITAIKKWLGTGSINIFGRPFAGKDTQGRILAELFGANLLGGGDILRGSEIPERTKEIMRLGKLIPTDDYISIVLPFLSKDEFSNQPLILSSVGRWVGEEEGVLEATKAAGHDIKAVIYLDLPGEAVHKRWSALHKRMDRGERHDDTPEILEIRLAEFKQKTLPVLEAYGKKDLLIEIDGRKSPEDVTEAIIEALASRASA